MPPAPEAAPAPDGGTRTPAAAVIGDPMAPVDAAEAIDSAAVDDGEKTLQYDIDAGIDWATCTLPTAPTAAILDPPDVSQPLPITVDADALVALSADRVVEFRGDVQVERGDLELRAARLVLDRDTQVVDASGGVLALRPDVRIAGSSALYDLDDGTGRIENAAFRIPAMRARGEASEIELLGERRSRHADIRFSTCRPGSDDWLLTADSLTLDPDAGFATADAATLSLFGVPVLYVPTFTFPIDDRRHSGFLVPSVGYNDSNGVDITVPYYFNLAENYDLTFSPRLMSERGLLLGGQFRYLTERSYGELEAELLPDDAAYDGSNSLRGAVGLRHETLFSDALRGDVRFGYVSDEEYLSDIGNNLTATSTTHIEQAGELRYAADTWTALGRVQDFQTIDEALDDDEKPYARLPQLLFSLQDPRGIAGTTYHLQAEYAYFHRDDSVRGHRIDLFPALSLPLRRSWGYLTPKVGARYTAYDLTDVAPGDDATPDTATPMASLDAGLFFDRQASWFGQSALHTLEPRLFYLHVPSKDQSDQPVFDTALQDFGFDRLFRENRFSGADRFGDANQVTLALSSRMLALDDGEELLRASIGQTYYFDDLDVTLPGQSPETDPSSPIAAELRGLLGGGWQGVAGIEWDPHGEGGGNVDQGLAELRYQGPGERRFRATYRMRESELETTDIAASWPVSDSVSLVGRHNYSLRENRLLEAVAGLEYRSCCWRLRTLLHSYAKGEDSDSNLGVLLQLELNGLGRFGNDIESVLERSIYGYR
jgi:LPS-assembly protein